MDSLSCKLIDNKWLEFSMDPRKLRLGLATDAFNPFSIQSTSYTCWLAMIVIYNLLPQLCMKK